MSMTGFLILACMMFSLQRVSTGRVSSSPEAARPGFQVIGFRLPPRPNQ
jgi:hypothetical protein